MEKKAYIEDGYIVGLETTCKAATSLEGKKTNYHLPVPNHLVLERLLLVNGEVIEGDNPLVAKDKAQFTEINWRDSELIKVLNRIDQYEKDQNYPAELRTSPFTAEQYNQLLQDRKLLSDYPSVEIFPFVERPVLSGLI
ncbi:hypothetical protein HWV01_15910 [Moritella sp. 5]|uniref:hypothetical protein n=1 Tax=Moritella sp. 5 TaxID=2746231 RepID=UPI001BA9A4B7|nr:hypothetical protein [Moritella sp. 5]QUM81660.1 hypothetical protein HWV01_15910 [Moritella sp. 5]